MTKRLLKTVFLAVLALSLSAGTLTLTSWLPDSEGQYHFLYENSPVELWCIDYHRPIPEMEWEVTVTHFLGNSAPLWVKQLDWLYRNAGSPLQFQYAAWLYMSGFTSPQGHNGVGLLLSLAFVPVGTWAHYSPDLWLYDGGKPVQRFVGFDLPESVPEPGSWLLLAGGLLVLGLLRRR